MFWAIGNDAERQILIRNLFTEVVYDLNTRRVVDFKLKPWADRFVILRGSLYQSEEPPTGGTPLESEEMPKNGLGVGETPVWGTLYLRIQAKIAHQSILASKPLIVERRFDKYESVMERHLL